MKEATRFIVKMIELGDVSILMSELDNAGIESKQNWKKETTTWIFEDRSKIRVCGSDVSIINP